VVRFKTVHVSFKIGVIVEIKSTFEPSAGSLESKQDSFGYRYFLGVQRDLCKNPARCNPLGGREDREGSNLELFWTPTLPTRPGEG